MELFSICYMSTKRQGLTNKEIGELVQKSLERNKQRDISGVLIEYKNHFLQYMEGPSREVFRVFDKIKIDNRHHSVEIVQFRSIEERIFPEWHILHKSLDKSSNEALGITDNIQTELDCVFENQEFWRGINVIEYLSNL